MDLLASSVAVPDDGELSTELSRESPVDKSPGRQLVVPGAIPADLSGLDDSEVLRWVRTFAVRERRATVALLAVLGEVERRGLHLREGYASLFMFCVKDLRHSEGAAYKRVHAARAGRRFPEIYSLLRDGALSLSAVAMLEPHLTPENKDMLLTRSQGLGKRQLEMVIVGMAPRPETRDAVRRLDVAAGATAAEHPRLSTGASVGAAQAELGGGNGSSLEGLSCQPLGLSGSSPDHSLARIQPLSPGRVKFSFTGSSELLEMVERARDLLRHKHPEGGLANVFAELARFYLDRKDPSRKVRAGRARPRGRKSGGNARRIPEAVKREAWTRDQGRCAYVSPSGRRCGAAAWLEYDHIRPWALGGRSDDGGNIRLLCRAHNQWEARARFGEGRFKRRG
ncbi:MAG: HNH endonuclease [Elusimicrobia bacterium]|nr:HNH endonuclease [Elusimicrobiota bacterium]